MIICIGCEVQVKFVLTKAGNLVNGIRRIICIFYLIRNQTFNIMAEEKNTSEEQSEQSTEAKKREKIRGYEQLIDRLKKERMELQDELGREYREARGYVRSHPEEGVLVALIGGVALGYILGRLGRK